VEQFLARLWCLCCGVVHPCCSCLSKLSFVPPTAFEQVYSAACDLARVWV
jgi:hypothetical protein